MAEIQLTAVRSMNDLAAAMRGGRVLTKTTGGRCPVYEVGRKRVAPHVAEEARRRGWLKPRDPGLFGPDTAQTFEFMEHTHVYA